VVRKRLASGETREYFDDRRSGVFLSNSREEATRLLAAEAERTKAPTAGTIAELIRDYQASSHFRLKLLPRTRQLYTGYLDIIQQDFGDEEVASFRPASVEFIKATYEAKPRKANQIVGLLRILFGRAVKAGTIASNPASRPEMIPTPPRDEVWSHADEEAFLAVAPPSLRLAFMLLLYTVQRPGDVLAMRTGGVRTIAGRTYLTLRQSKTGMLIDVPVHSRLRPFLEDRLSPSWLPSTAKENAARAAQGLVPRYQAVDTDLLVPSPTGRPWAYRNFGRAWDNALAKADVTGLQRRDLRRTGIVRLAEAGATTPQIAAVSGHAIDYSQRIIDTYLPRRTEVALGAIALWESQDQAIIRAQSGSSSATG
jgi:integrase